MTLRSLVEHGKTSTKAKGKALAKGPRLPHFCKALPKGFTTTFTTSGVDHGPWKGSWTFLRGLGGGPSSQDTAQVHEALDEPLAWPLPVKVPMKVPLHLRALGSWRIEVATINLTTGTTKDRGSLHEPSKWLWCLWQGCRVEGFPVNSKNPN